LQSQEHARRQFLRFLAASPLLAGSLPTLATAQTPTSPPLITSASQALNVFNLQAAAERTLPPAHYGFLMTGVLDDRTLNANAAGYLKWGILPRRLTGVMAVDRSCKLFGETFASPVLLCPVSSLKAFHTDGERAVARAARSRSALQMLSTVTGTSIEQVIADRSGPTWFQLYPTNDFAVTTQLVKRADAAGASAIVLTVDLLTGGMRRETLSRLMRIDTRDCSTCHERPPGGAPRFDNKPMFEGLDMSRATNLNNPTLTWDYVSRIRDITKKPVLVKGLMTADDARLALKAGASGIVVSNHGGRSEESLIGTIDALPSIVTAIAGKIPVIVDGGIRRGTDVFKALALGADAVGIGRPYAWGLGAFGEDGVTAAMRLIDDELASAMRQTGVARVADIGRTSVTSLK
jgi:(S)-2-hydroxy-acid oxidase